MEFRREQYLNKLLENKHNHLVKIITGLRRVGKSYLLFNLFKRQLLRDGVREDHIIEMAFDNFAYRAYRKGEKLYNYVKERIGDEGMYYVLFDEVQLLEDFVDVLNGLLYMPNVDVYVTGSNAKFLSSDVVTEFRGRGVQVHVSPLSFKEFVNAYEGDRYGAWQEYMLYGGLPMVVLTRSHKGKEELLKSLLLETYLNDIVGRNRLKNEAELEDVLNVLASNIGALTNPQKLSNTFASEKHVNILPERIKRYIDYFTDSFLVERSMRYDVKGRKYIDTPYKYYFTDSGLRNAQINFRQVEPTHLMENVVYNELRRRGYGVDVGAMTKYTKCEGKTQRINLEVDFVCNRGSERLYVQSAYSLPTEEKMKQELRSLELIEDSFRKLVITADNVPSYVMDNGIEIVNLFDFLLDDAYVEREARG